LTVTDIDGATGTDEVTVTVRPTPNTPPAADAGADQTITLPTNSITLDGSNSQDNDGTIANYNWTYVSGPSTYNIVSAGSATTAVNNLVAGVYTFMLTVTDDDGAKATNTVVVTVNKAPNVAPTASAGPDRTVTLPTNTVTLNGSGSDNDGTITRYNWTYVSGPTTYNIVSVGSAATVVNLLVEGVYKFRLTVTDNDNATASSEVTVTVNRRPNQAPAANAGGNRAITLPTNSITLNGSGTDNDGTISSYRWTYVSGPATYNIVSANSATTVVNTLVEGVYRFRLTVTDNDGATATSDVTVTVNAAVVNQPPTASAGPNQTIVLPTNSVTVNGAGMDNDGSIVGYQWTWLTGPTHYSITDPNSASTSITDLEEGTYTFRLTVTDDDGATATSHIAITVERAPNVSPVANAGVDFEVPRSAQIRLDGTGSYDPDGIIKEYFWSKVSGPSPSTMTDFETTSPVLWNPKPGTYVFSLTVTDDRGGTSIDYVTLVVVGSLTARAGADTTLSAPVDSYNLSGSALGGNGTISYKWERVEGAPDVTFSNGSIANPVVSNLKAGKYTFRLTVKDIDGEEATDEVVVDVKDDHVYHEAVIIYPNPVDATLNYKIFSDGKETVGISILDINGHVLKKVETQISAGVNMGTIDVSGLAPRAVYIFQTVYSDGQKKATKFLKK
jgi:hypothetical protein